MLQGVGDKDIKHGHKPLAVASGKEGKPAVGALRILGTQHALGRKGHGMD